MGPGLIHFFYGGARIEDIGENHAGPAENVVLQRHMAIDADIVLQLAVVPYHRAVVYKDVLADIAVSARSQLRS